MLKIENIEIQKIIRNKRKTFKIEINNFSEITLRIPLLATDFEIKSFLENNYDWILKTFKKIESSENTTKFIRKYSNEEEFLYLGEFYKLQIKTHTNFAFKFDGSNFILSEKAIPQAKPLFENFYKSKARAIITSRVYDIALKLGVKFNNLKITSAKTRWGSCNSKGNVNFSWRLIMAKPIVIDYVIIHEFCHLFELNHSENFWKLVEKIMPDYKLQKKWLDENTKYMIV
jgi:predicted metal-dependent hydrolase